MHKPKKLAIKKERCRKALVFPGKLSLQKNSFKARVKRACQSPKPTNVTAKEVNNS